MHGRAACAAAVSAVRPGALLGRRTIVTCVANVYARVAGSAQIPGVQEHPRRSCASLARTLRPEEWVLEHRESMVARPAGAPGSIPPLRPTSHRSAVVVRRQTSAHWRSPGVADCPPKRRPPRRAVTALGVEQPRSAGRVRPVPNPPSCSCPEVSNSEAIQANSSALKPPYLKQKALQTRHL